MAEEKIRRRPYGAPNADGFPGGEEEQVAYCPREKRKKSPAEHRSCEHHAADGIAPEELDESAACDFPESEKHREDREEEEKEEE